MRAAVRVRLLVFVLLGAVAVAYVGGRYAGLTGLLSSNTYKVTIELARSGGLFPRAEVDWRGTTVGRVTDMTVQRTGVLVTIEIGDRWRIPDALVAAVHNRSAVGEQYLELEPTRDGGPFLHDGSRIDQSQTSTPIEDQQLLLALHRLTTSIDTGALRTVVDQAAVALQGSGPDIANLITDWRIILEQANSSLPAQLALLASAHDVLSTQAHLAPVIAGWARDTLTVTRVLSGHAGDLTTILAAGTRAARTLNELATALQTALPPLLAGLVPVAQLLSTRVSGLEETLVALPWALASAQTPGRNGLAHFTFVGTSDPAACQQGYIPPSRWRSALDSTRSAVPPTIGCTQPGAVPRGAASVHGN
ncbi:ABC transporter substrate-binding protein [Nocardioides baekrokdamisoli]|uniref:ABC transporter substrate-binding protein n=1 Tax=Nocardioides baekrokdamisoli TaxID=1804624 RepID=A0A3G9IYC4_9ACTN|nr:MlaD family protein [Nocardioides baekrokdamisoli]BBH15739.1 ABC transporter substrate-binding protein [Nocardioides baekrokdamisoli]